MGSPARGQQCQQCQEGAKPLALLWLQPLLPRMSPWPDRDHSSQQARGWEKGPHTLSSKRSQGPSFRSDPQQAAALQCAEGLSAGQGAQGAGLGRSGQTWEQPAGPVGRGGRPLRQEKLRVALQEPLVGLQDRGLKPPHRPEEGPGTLGRT